MFYCLQVSVMQKKIIFLTGVSGAGKTTIMDLLLEDPQFVRVCSTTTRKKREWENEWEHYLFVSTIEFEQGIEDKKFLEYAYVHQIAYYGTRIDLIQAVLDQWKMPVKTIDPIGMEIVQMKWKISGQYLCFFLDIPEHIMRERILHRQPDMNDIELQHRLDSAHEERVIAKRLDCIMIDASPRIEEVLATVKSYL